MQDRKFDGFDAVDRVKKKPISIDETLDADARLPHVEDAKLTIMVQLGAAPLKLRNVIALKKSSVVSLDVFAGEPLEIYINQRLVAKGEAVVVNEKRLGIRLTDIVTPSERIARSSKLTSSET